MAQYREGTVSVTTGSAVVTGTGTAWAGQIIPGQIFSLYRSGISYVVAEVLGNTQLRLSDSYKGPSAVHQPYTVTRDFTPYYNLPYPDYGDIDTAALWKDLAIKVEQAIVAQDTGLTVIESRVVATPPATPSERVNYIVPANATGAWAGKAPLIAVWDNDIWKFIQPQEGWRVHVRDESYVDYIFDEGGWQPGPQVGEAVLAAAAYRDEARAWAEKTDGPVTGTAHSARHHAEAASASAQTAQTAASAAAGHEAASALAAAAAAVDRQGAETARGDAETASDAALAARTGSETALAAAVAARTGAEAAQTLAEAARSAAGVAEAGAAAAQAAAETARSGADSARAGAQAAETAAAAVSSTVLGYRDETAVIRSEAVAARDLATAARTGAETARTDAQSALSAAMVQADAATTAAATATAKATQAADFSGQAALSASAAVQAQSGAETARAAAAAAQTGSGDAKMLAIVAQSAAETARDTAVATAASIATRVGEADAARAAAEAAKANAANSAAAAAVSATDALIARTDAAAARDATIALRDAALAAQAKAQAWSETAQGTEVEPGLYSAKHHALESREWAQQAAAVVGGNNFAIIGDGTSQRVVAQNPGELLNLIGTAGVQAVYNQATRSVTFKGVAGTMPIAPAGGISAETVLDALYELDGDKLDATHAGTGGGAHALADDATAGFLSPQHHALLAGATAAPEPSALVRRDGAGELAGNAGTASALKTARTLSLGGVVATPVGFDGSADVEIPVTAVPASLLTGTVALANLPAGALERLVQVADDAARFALTIAEVQTGDTVQVGAGGPMYRVVDPAQLDSEAGYVEYTAGAAASVPWSGVTGVPATLADLAGRSIGYGDATDIPAKSDVAVAISTAIAALSPNSLTAGDSSLTLSDGGSGATVNLTVDAKNLLKVGSVYDISAFFAVTQAPPNVSNADNSVVLYNPIGGIRIFGARSDTNLTGTTGGQAIVSGGNAASGSNRNGGPGGVNGGAGDGSGNGGSASVNGGAAGATGRGGSGTVSGGNGGSTSGNGGAVWVTAGNATSGTGGMVTMTAGNTVNGTGGAIAVAAGNASGTGDGGGLGIGAGNATNGTGGWLGIKAGDGGGTDKAGGRVSITAGNSTGTEEGAGVWISAGHATGSGAGGSVVFQSGTSAGSYSGLFYFVVGATDWAAAIGAGRTSNEIGFVALTAGSTSAGRDAYMQAGGGVGTNQNGGNVRLTAGYQTGTGIPGNIDLEPASGGYVRIGAGGRLKFADGTTMSTAATGSGLVNTAVLTGSNAAVAGQRVLYDTRSAPGTLTLPAAPVDGDQVAVLDAHYAFATHNLTVERNGKTIAGSASNLDLDLNGTSLTLMYVAATGDWVILNLYARSA